MHSLYFNDGSQRPAELVDTLNMMTISGRHRAAAGPHFRLRGVPTPELIHSEQDGFSAMQSHLLLPTRLSSFKARNWFCTKAAIITIEKLEAAVQRWKKQGYQCATIILGNGSESIDEAIHQARQVVQLSKAFDLPIYIELHRGSITQDILTTLAMVEACPQIGFNADFSHYMIAYRLDQLNDEQLQQTLTLMQPIFKRVAFCHTRFASSSHVQTMRPSNRARTVYLLMMQQVLLHFKQQSGPGDKLFIAPELLPPFTGYGDFDCSASGHSETIDRYLHALQLNQEIDRLFQGDAVDSGKHSERPDSKLLFINSPEGFRNITLSHYNSRDTLRICLGSALKTQSEQQALLDAYLEFQHSDNRIMLATRRNSMTHTLAATQQLIDLHPQIRLSLDVSEWILGEEVTPGKLPAFIRRLRRLRPQISENRSRTATAEYLCTEPARFSWKAWLQPSVIIEWLYRLLLKHEKKQTVSIRPQA